MGKINILSEKLANKIAAGEVVERPASVVKELVENAIDANSSNIKIIIEEFGIKEIRIIDNGNGISNDDIKKAFLRHATSKISKDFDLFHINTLGFRGEALASIASVSEIEIKSCANEEQGKFLMLKAGVIETDEFYPPIKGTDISVKNLFFNTPARLKYLKNSYTEQALIVSIVHKLALAHPNIAFELIVDGKITIKTYGDNNLHKVISKVYNVNVAKNMLNFLGENDDYKIDGFISSPEETRASKNYIHIFINGRYIKNYAIQNAIISAYDTFLMKNRYPLSILNIKMSPSLLDVNVHPTKQEVRLSKEEELIELIKNTIKNRLLENTYIPDGITNVIRKKENNQFSQVSFSSDLDNNFYSVNNIENHHIKKEEINNYLDFIDIPIDNNSYPTHDKIKETSDFNYSFDDKVEDFEIDKFDIEENEQKSLPQLQVLAQIFKTYILAQTGDELYLIDQHAAQERYNFEKIQEKIKYNHIIKKQLLIPLTLNFSIEEYTKVIDLKQQLEKVGISIEAFGNSTIIIREYPIWIEEDIEHHIQLIIEKVVANPHISIEELRHDAIAMSSCKSSLKANQHLNKEDMEQIIQDLYQCQNPFTCPHGRPIITKMSKTDLEKMFKRIV